MLLFKAFVVGVLGFLLWCGWNYTKPSNFPIKQVKIISSYEHLSQKQLQNIIASYVDNGFFYLNVIGMKWQLLKLPWVYAVSVQRKWPDTVIVSVVEQQAVLQWGFEGLVNHKGEVFMPSIATFPRGLPVIFSPEKQEQKIFILYQKAQQLFEPLDLSVKQLLLTPQHYWEILLSNGTKVYLKESEPLDQLEFLTNLYRRITSDHKDSPKSIDLRYNNDGLAVKWE
jgi:cell division protein FtsQ